VIQLPQAVQVSRVQPAAFASTPGALEILVAPIALYPDALLPDLLAATTHPSQILQANQWVHQPRNAWGGLPAAGYNPKWDSSIKAMTAYPDLLQRLSEDMDWVTRLGSAYEAQPFEVINAVARVRNQAYSAPSASVKIGTVSN